MIIELIFKRYTLPSAHCLLIPDAHAAPSIKKLSAHLDRICTNYTYI